MISKVSESMHIWTKDEYAKFTKRLSKSEVKKKVFLRLASMKKD